MTIKQYITRAIDYVTGRKQRQAEEEQRYTSAVNLLDAVIRLEESNARSRAIIAESDRVGAEARRLSEEFNAIRKTKQ